MTAMAALGALSAAQGGGGMPSVTGGAAGPATSGSEGSFWTDITNGDFIMGGGSKSGINTAVMVTAIVVAGVVLWLISKK